MPSTRRLGAFKLTHLAGAYWRGDERNQQLTRVYGTAWATQEDLDEHLHRFEEAERRDHRRLGAELDLFSFPDEIGSGLAVFHPRGGLVRKLMEDYSRQRHEEAGYEFVNTPHITKSRAVRDQRPPGVVRRRHVPADGARRRHGVLPEAHELPDPHPDLPEPDAELPRAAAAPVRVRRVYRYEKSGVIHGLTRVRGLTMDDAHIFTTKEQMGEELRSLLDVRPVAAARLRPRRLLPRAVDQAGGQGRRHRRGVGGGHRGAAEAAESMDLELVMDEGGGAFYGPKISVQARDAIGRTWQMSTIQVDFQMPQRFDLHYAGDDSERHRPIMIHRALFGSVERFFGVLTEHYAGAFPLWLAPEQVRLVPVADRHVDLQRAGARARAAGLRVVVDDSKESVGKKIRAAQLMKAPYTLVIGRRSSSPARTPSATAPAPRRRACRSSRSSRRSSTRRPRER